LLDHLASIVVITSVIIVPPLISPLIVSIVDTAIESLDSPFLSASPSSHIFWHILNILHAVVPLPLDVLRDIVNLLLFPPTPSCHILRCIFNVLNPVVPLSLDVVARTVGVVVETLLVALPVLLYIVSAVECKGMLGATY